MLGNALGARLQRLAAPFAERGQLFRSSDCGFFPTRHHAQKAAVTNQLHHSARTPQHKLVGAGHKRGMLLRRLDHPAMQHVRQFHVVHKGNFAAHLCRQVHPCSPATYRMVGVGILELRHLSDFQFETGAVQQRPVVDLLVAVARAHQAVFHLQGIQRHVQRLRRHIQQRLPGRGPGYP